MEKVKLQFRKFIRNLILFVDKLSQNFESGKRKEAILRDTIWKQEMAKCSIMIYKSKQFVEKYGDFYTKLACMDSATVRKFQDFYI